MDRKENNKNEGKAKKTSLTLPRPVSIGSSPLSSPFLRKLPPLSPRSMKLLDSNYNGSEECNGGKNSAQMLSSSAGSNGSSIGSDSLSTGGDPGNVFSFQRKPSESLEDSSNDIEFFLQVVGAFKEYVSNQVDILEQLYTENCNQLQGLQRAKKQTEERNGQSENQLSRDVAHLVSLLHRKQAELKSVLQKRNQEKMTKFREEEERCRRTMKLVSELLSFARRLLNESGESFRGSLVREFKDRLARVTNLVLPGEVANYREEEVVRIDADALKVSLEDLNFLTDEDKQAAKQNSNICIKAPHSSDDITNSSITARWCSMRSDKLFVIQWKYIFKRQVIEKEACDVSEHSYVITDLPANREVAVRVRHSGSNTDWSEEAKFKTLEIPAPFVFDSSTAHVKLKLSPDQRMVCFERDKLASPKSPSRFSFALNVLGNRAFFTGRHYWEFGVNQDGWACGVAYQGVPRNSWLGSNPQSWILHHHPSKFKYKVRHAGEAHDVLPELSNPSKFLKRVGVYLDVEEGIIRFADSTRQRVLFTYEVERFVEPICAAANPFYNGGCLTLFSGLDVPKYLGELNY